MNDKATAAMQALDAVVQGGTSTGTGDTDRLADIEARLAALEALMVPAPLASPVWHRNQRRSRWHT